MQASLVRAFPFDPGSERNLQTSGALWKGPPFHGSRN